jgi:hypothetical protein
MWAVQADRPPRRHGVLIRSGAGAVQSDENSRHVAKLAGTKEELLRWEHPIRVEEGAMSERELNQPHQGDKRYQRRNEDGSFAESDDVSKSLRQDVKQHAEHAKPKNEGDKGD